MEKSNADKIRSMTDEELAEFLADSLDLIEKVSHEWCLKLCPKNSSKQHNIADCDFINHDFEVLEECPYAEDKDLLLAWLQSGVQE